MREKMVLGEEAHWRMQTKTGLLVARLFEERQMKYRGGIYHLTQIELAYNSNRIEGSRLSKEQTASLFETKSLFAEAGEPIRSDDVVEAHNHFRAFDFLLDRYQEALTEGIIKRLHGILKAGTSDADVAWFKVGDYKCLPNVVGDSLTTPPENVPEQMGQLLRSYSSVQRKSLDTLLAFHYRFEKIHPFQDGNGRVGRLLLYKECLNCGIVPFVIDERHKLYYYNGLRQFTREKGFLRDTCLSAQDKYVEFCKQLVLGFERAPLAGRASSVARHGGVP